MKRASTARVALNVLIAACVAAGMLMMALGIGEMFVSKGRGSLKYYTTLSNLFEGGAALLWLAVNAVGKMPERVKRAADTLKYASCVCVGLTFLTVLVFLGPMYGYPKMYTYANFFFHLAVPVLAMAEFVFFHSRAMSLSDNFLALLPTLLYGTVYLLNILINGLGEPFQRDIYGFVTWGIPIGMGIFAVIGGAAFFIGLLLRTLNRRLTSRGIGKGVDNGGSDRRSADR